MKKLITLTALLLCAVVSSWADPVTIGITNTTTTSKSQATTETLTGSGDDITVSKLALSASSTALSVYSTGDKAMNDGNSTSVYSTHTYKWNKNTGSSIDDAYMNTSYPNEYVGFSFTVAPGKTFSISGISAKLASSANHVFRIRIEDNSGNVLYTAASKTINRTSDNEQNISDLNSTNAANIQSLSAGTYKVKAFLAFSSTGKYLVFTKLQVTGTLGDDSTPSYTMTAAVNNADYGSASANSSSVLEGKSVTFTASSNPGYKFVNWTNTSTSAVVSSENPYTIASVSEDVSLTANFETAHSVSYSNYSTFYGTRTDNNFTETFADDKDKFTAPVNLYLSSDNQTLTGWNDGTTTYAVNDKIDCSAGDKTLSPVFTTNSGATFAETLDARTAGFTTTWNFGSNHAMFIMQNTTGYYVKQATINGASVDIPMFINTNPGKFNTEGDNTERAQINNGTILRIPVVDGSVVTLTGLYAFGTTDRNSNSCTQTTINGGTEYDLSNSNKTATYTYSGATGTIDIVVGGDMAWGTSLSVTYPSPYSVTYDGNGAESGSVADASTYDKNASVTTKTNSFTKAGYTFKEWNTAADGSGDSYAAGSKITITDNTTLYAQWMEGTEEAITFVVKTKSADAATTPSTHLTNLVNETNVGIDAVTDQSKDDRSGKYKTSSNEGEGVQFSFDIAEGYTFQPTLISMQLATVSTTDFTFQVTLTDSKGTKLTSSELNTFTGDGILTDVTFPAYDKIFESGTVTMLVTAVRAGGSGTYRIGKNITITGAVARENVTIPVSAAGYATFYTDKALDFTGIEDITAYTATQEAGAVVTFNKVTGAVPAETGLLVKGVTTNVPVAASADPVSNILVGTLTDTTIDAGNFVLLKQNDVVGFYRTTGSFSARANSAWLPSTVAVSSVRFIGFDDEGGEATGIQEVSTASVKAEQVYNLRGQRVAQPSKGLYIVNGKKVVLK